MVKKGNTQSVASLNLDICGIEDSKIWLLKPKPILIFQEKSNQYKNENILAKIVEAIKKYDLDFSQIEKIYICCGPGSYINSRIVSVMFNLIAQNYNNTLYQYHHNQSYLKAKTVDKITPTYQDR